MIFQISRTARLHVRRPLWVEWSKDPQLELRLPAGVHDVAVPPVPTGYHLRILKPSDVSALLTLLQRVGFGFDARTLEAALSVCLPRGCFIVEHIPTGLLSATTMAIHVASRSHPFGGQIGWLATDPDHRKRGLATICAGTATRRLLEAGYDDVWVTTDDHRLGALNALIRIGFVPAPTPSTASRWHEVLQELGTSLTSTSSRSTP